MLGEIRNISGSGLQTIHSVSWHAIWISILTMKECPRQIHLENEYAFDLENL